MRWLAAAAIPFSAAVFAANYILPAAWLPYAAAVLTALGIALLFMRRKWLRVFITAILGFACGLGCFYVHYTRTARPTEALDGQVLVISAVIEEYPVEYDDYCRVTVRICTEGVPALKAILYDDSMAIADKEPGQRLTVTAKLSSAGMRYGEEYDHYYSKGIYLILNAHEEPSFSGTENHARYIPLRISREISRLCSEAFPEDVSPFMRSIMLGDKADLYGDEALYLALSRAGLMHIVAVSGMHIAFLVGLLQFLFGRGWKSSALCLALIFLFVLMAGAPPSAVRAGIMQGFLLLAPLLKRENDPVTSLSAALALILIFNPYAAGSVSLQLSFAAIAGMLTLTGRIGETITAALPEGRFKEKSRYTVGVVAASLSVMAFTLPLSAIHFGYISLLAPISNILALSVVPVCFCGGYAVCALAALSRPLAAAAAWLISWPVRYIFLCARLVSAIPFSSVYLQGPVIVCWLALVYLLYAIAFFSRTGSRFKVIFPTALSAAALIFSLGLTKLCYASGIGTVSVLDVGQGQCICVFSGDRTMVIDCGGLWSFDNAGETAGAYLSSRGRSGVDILLLTHLHADHANGATMLMEMQRVKLLLLPENPQDDDGLLDGILRCAEKYGTEVRYISEDSGITAGGINAQLFAPGKTGGANERCVMAKVSVGNYDMLVTADSPKSAERELVDELDLSGTELLIAGHHGSRYASSGELLEEIGGGTAVISVGYNTFGHPTYETLQRLSAYGFDIFRTDLNGTVEIRIG